MTAPSHTVRAFDPDSCIAGLVHPVAARDSDHGAEDDADECRADDDAVRADLNHGAGVFESRRVGCPPGAGGQEADHSEGGSCPGADANCGLHPYGEGDGLELLFGFWLDNLGACWHAGLFEDRSWGRFWFALGLLGRLLGFRLGGLRSRLFGCGRLRGRGIAGPSCEDVVHRCTVGFCPGCGRPLHQFRGNPHGGACGLNVTHGRGL